MNEQSGDRTSSGGQGSAPSPASVTPPAGRKGFGRVFWKIACGAADVLNLGPETPQNIEGRADVSTRLAYRRTDLALERNYLAAERTLMAWIRTALSMISFGFTIGKLGDAINSIKVGAMLGIGRTVSIDSIAYFLVILGTGSLLSATVQNWLQVREFRAMGLRRRISVGFYVALLLTFVGGFALSALVLKL